MLDIFFELAEHMGMLDKVLKTLCGIRGWNYEELKAKVEEARRKGESMVKGIYLYNVEELAKKLGVSPEEVERELKEKGQITIKECHKFIKEAPIPWKYPAPTPSGRIEIYSLLFYNFIKKYGYKPNWDPVITYIPPNWREGLKPEDKLPLGEFYFVYGKVPTMAYTNTVSNDLLTALTQKIGRQSYALWINRKTAEAMGIKDGDIVEVENAVSGQKIRVEVYLTEMIRPDTVFLPAAFGSEVQAFNNMHGKGAPLNAIIPYRVEPAIGAYKSEQFTVKVRRVGG